MRPGVIGIGFFTCERMCWIPCRQSGTHRHTDSQSRAAAGENAGDNSFPYALEVPAEATQARKKSVRTANGQIIARDP